MSIRCRVLSCAILLMLASAAEAGGPDTVVQIDPEKDLCRVLVPRYSVYMEFAATDGAVAMFNPFLALEEMRAYYEVKQEGEEECAGHPCTKEAFLHGDTAVLRQVPGPARREPLRQSHGPPEWTRRFRLEPGERRHYELQGRKEVHEYGLTFVAPGGRARVVLEIDHRSERKPF